jgi:hypothetical protein
MRTVKKGALMTSLETGFSYSFFLSSSESLNLVYTVNRSDPSLPVSGYFNFEVITSPGGTSYSLPTGYQGMALLPGGTGSQLDVQSGSIGVIDTGSSNTIVLGTGTIRSAVRAATRLSAVPAPILSTGPREISQSPLAAPAMRRSGAAWATRSAAAAAMSRSAAPRAIRSPAAHR